MRVRLLVSRCGPAGAENVGEEIDVQADEGERMIAAGQCEIVRRADVTRAVSRGGAEKAVR